MDDSTAKAMAIGGAIIAIGSAPVSLALNSAVPSLTADFIGTLGMICCGVGLAAGNNGVLEKIIGIILIGLGAWSALFIFPILLTAHNRLGF